MIAILIYDSDILFILSSNRDELEQGPCNADTQVYENELISNNKRTTFMMSGHTQIVSHNSALRLEANDK